MFISSFAPTFLQNYCLELAVQQVRPCSCLLCLQNQCRCVHSCPQRPRAPLRKDTLTCSPNSHTHGRDATPISQMQWRWWDHHTTALHSKPCAESWGAHPRNQERGPRSTGPEFRPPRMAHERPLLLSDN